MGVVSTYTANTMLNSSFYGKPTYIGLHISDPTVLGDYGTEVASGDYIRQQVQFSDAGSRGTGNITQALFVGMPDVTVTHLAIWDNVTTGNMLSFKALDVPIDVADGQTFVVPVSTVAVSFT